MYIVPAALYLVCWDAVSKDRWKEFEKGDLLWSCSNAHLHTVHSSLFRLADRFQSSLKSLVQQPDSAMIFDILGYLYFTKKTQLLPRCRFGRPNVAQRRVRRVRWIAGLNLISFEPKLLFKLGLAAKHHHFLGAPTKISDLHRDGSRSHSF